MDFRLLQPIFGAPENQHRLRNGLLRGLAWPEDATLFQRAQTWSKRAGVVISTHP